MCPGGQIPMEESRHCYRWQHLDEFMGDEEQTNIS